MKAEEREYLTTRDCEGSPEVRVFYGRKHLQFY